MTLREIGESLNRKHAFAIGLFVGAGLGVWASNVLPNATFLSLLSPFGAGFTLAYVTRLAEARRDRAAEYRELAKLVRDAFEAGQSAEDIARTVERGST
jgi:hypothetical protein